MSKVYKTGAFFMLIALMPFIGQAQLPGLPSGWGFSLNPTSATYVIPTTVMFEGVDALQAGDWVGAFFEDDGMLYCAGAVQWTGIDNLALIAFGNDELEPVKNGLADGELVKWKFYHEATMEEVVVKAYDTGGNEFFWSSATLDEVDKFGADLVVCEQSFNFSAGWNWLSFNVLPDGTSAINDVLGIAGYTGGDFIQTPGGTAEFFEGFGWFGTLTNITPDRMYQLRLTASNALTVTGICVEPSTPIALTAGWNWIGFKPQVAIEINTALGSLTPTQGDFIQTVGGTAEYFSGFGWFGTMSELAPGKGYQIKLTNADQLIYP